MADFINFKSTTSAADKTKIKAALGVKTEEQALNRLENYLIQKMNTAKKNELQDTIKDTISSAMLPLHETGETLP